MPILFLFLVGHPHISLRLSELVPRTSRPMYETWGDLVWQACVTARLLGFITARVYVCIIFKCECIMKRQMKKRHLLVYKLVNVISTVCNCRSKERPPYALLLGGGGGALFCRILLQTSTSEAKIQWYCTSHGVLRITIGGFEVERNYMKLPPLSLQSSV